MKTPGIEFRYDKFNHELHFKGADNATRIIHNLLIGFWMEDKGRYFQIINYQDRMPLVEVVSSGKYSLVKFYSSKVVSFELGFCTEFFVQRGNANKEAENRNLDADH